MIGKKINQLATELAPVSTDLTIIGDPISGVSKKITLAQLGAIFSGAVSFYTNLASFPATGDINVIYCAKDTQKLYLWSGSAYVEVFPSQALLDTYQLRSEKGNANGYASLDSLGKVPISQLPSSLMEYKGTWNASTNTPTLANGTGDTGDVYICNVAGTVNFGAGPLTFAVGDYVIYSGTIWQRSSGAVGTVTSVAASITGNSIGITGSPITTSGTLALAFAGTSAQYINGAGNLITFPTSLISGSGASGQVTFFNGANSVTGTNNFFWDATNNRLGIGTTTPQRSIEIFNSTADNHLRLSGNAPSVSMGEAVTGSIYQAKFGLVTTNGQFASAGVAGDFVIISQTGATIFVTNSTEKMRVNASGNMSVGNTNDTYRLDVTGTARLTGQLRLESTITNGTYTYTLPSATGTLALTSDIPSLTGYVPYTGATANLDLGTHTLIAAKGTFSSSGSSDTVGITHSSGSGIALNITKGGNGEGLYINKTSGSGNAATIIGTLNATTLVKSGGTSSQFLKADGSVDSTSYGTGSVTSVGLSSATSGVTIGSTPITTSGTITLAIATASGSQQGLLSSTDWTTFNNKQNALTNPVTGTGTTNYLPKFTGASTIGDSLVYDNGTNVGIGTTSPSAYGGTGLTIQSNTTANIAALVLRNSDSSVRGHIYTNGSGNSLVVGTATSSVLQLVTVDTVRATLDASGNLGLGVTPSAWGTYIAYQVGWGSMASYNGSDTAIFSNTYFDGGTWRYIGNGNASQYRQLNSVHSWHTAPSGTAGNAISFTQAMTLDASGNLVVGDTTTSGRLRVVGNAATNGLTVKSAGNGGTFPFRVTWANGTDGSMFCVEDNGRVGIGTTSPVTLLDVRGEVSISYNATYGLRFYNQDRNNWSFIGNSIATGDTSANLRFGDSTGEVMRITGGKVGIGTTSPNLSGAASGSTVQTISATISGRNALLELNGTRTGDGDFAGYLRYFNNSAATPLAEMYALRGSSDTTGSLVLATSGTERMRITSGGTVCIGNTTGAGDKLAITQSGVNWAQTINHTYTTQFFLDFRYNGIGIGSIIGNGTTTSYNVTSDYRLKQDFKDYSGLDLVNKIKTYDYEWKADKTRSYGVIAHELQSVINYAVTGVKDGKDMQGVDYSKIVPVLIKAIQEQQTQIEQLKNK
jgi:hypothetical protein